MSDLPAFSLDATRAVWREVGDEVVVLDVSTATYLTLNGSARRLWKRLDAGASREDLVRELVGAYGIAAELAGADVDAFLASLHGRDLLTR